MKIAVLVHEHRFGTDPIIFAVPDYYGCGNLPKITNELLAKAGVDFPELERDDETAEWCGIFDVTTLPVID
jgi:hypothetical protein